MPSISRITKPYVVNTKTKIVEYFPEKDILQNELKQLAQRYKETLSIKDKALVLEKEREIIFQEIEDPSLTILRNGIDWSKKGVQSTTEYIQSLNIFALRFLEFLEKPFKTTVTQEKVDSLERLYKELEIRPKENSIALAHIKDILTTYQDFDITNTITFKKPRNTIKTRKKDCKLDLNRLDYENITASKFWEIMNSLTINKMEEDAREVVRKLLKIEGLNKDVKDRVVFAAGRERSNDAFEALKEIALNPVKDNCYRQKELALHSIARYLREKEDEVKQTLEYVKNNDEFYSPLAEILLAKCNGNYHGVKNRELKTMGDFLNINDFIEKYIKFDGEINTQRKNSIDCALKKLEDFIPILIKNKFNVLISEDTLTKIKPYKTGIRASNGPFLDSLNGVSSGKMIFLDPRRLEGNFGASILCHEIAHQLDVLADLAKSFESYYTKACKEGTAVSTYAQLNIDEFFAENFAAMNCYYVPEEFAFTQRTGAPNSIYKLRDINPELYEYCKKIIESLKSAMNSPHQN